MLIEYGVIGTVIFMVVLGLMYGLILIKRYTMEADEGDKYVFAIQQPSATVNPRYSLMTISDKLPEGLNIKFVCIDENFIYFTVNPYYLIDLTDWCISAKMSLLFNPELPEPHNDNYPVLSDSDSVNKALFTATQ